MSIQRDNKPPKVPWYEQRWFGLKLILWSVIAICFLYLFSCEFGGDGYILPRYAYTDTRTELTFDGEKIVIEGRVECRRMSGSFYNGSSVDFLRRSHYYCAPNWFAHQLPQGGVLFVRAYAVSKKFPRIGSVDLSRHHDTVKTRPPAVVWVDDAESPTRSEIYYSTVYFNQPGARLTSIETRIVSVRTHTYVPQPYSHPEETVPVLYESGGPWIGRGHYAVLVPKETWARVPGLEEILSQYNEPVQINANEQLSKDQLTTLLKTARFRSVNWSLRMRNSPDGSEGDGDPSYDQSKRTVPLILDVDGVYTLDRSQPRGRLIYYAQPYQKTFPVRIGGREFEEQPKSFPYRFYYDPEFKQIIKIDAP